MAFQPTPQQLAAINAPHYESAVVTAAAGSGKTTLLVDRILRLLSDPSLGISADSLAILTFTRNAASSLRAKLIKKMTEQIKALAADSSTAAAEKRILLTEQMIALRSASIGTIDSFCINVIKENVSAFGLPMNFGIADNARVFSMKNLAMKRTLNFFYNSADEEGGVSAEQREELFHTFSFENDEKLQQALLETADTLCTYADRDEWLLKCEKIYSDFDSAYAFYINAFVEQIRKAIGRNQPVIDRLNSVVEAYKQEIECEEDEAKKAKKREVLDTITQYVEDVTRFITAKADAFNALGERPAPEAMDDFFSDMDNYSFAEISKSDPKSEAKKALTQVKKGFSLFDELSAICFSVERERMMSSQQTSAMTTFIKLIRMFLDSYRSIMHSSGMLDFAECEYLLLEKLRSDRSLCEHLSSRFSCIIVDEFQDSNDIQAEIFRLVSDGKSNLFYVGDVKQAIYAFRGGNPAIMGRLCDKPSTLMPKRAFKKALFDKRKTDRFIAENRFTVLPLNMNFRSRRNIVDFVNDMFTGVMTKKFGGVEYNSNSALALGSDRVYKDLPEDIKDRYKTEIHLLCYQDDNDERNAAIKQAAFVAQKIRQMYDEKTLVSDGKELRECRFGDFAVLLRTNTHIADYKQTIEALGIPCQTAKSTQFLAAEEITLILDLLNVIDNPLKDEEMLRVIMSPLFGFTAEEVAEIRLGILGMPSEAMKHDISPIINLNADRSLYGCMAYCARTEEPNTKNIAAEMSERSVKAKECIKQLSEKGIVRTVNEKLRGFLDKLEKFRFVMSNSPLDELIRFVYDETEMFNIISTYEGSRQRLANIRLLRKYAADFEDADGGTLSDFLRFVNQMDKDALDAANITEDSSNAVQIMTFHASKGLEMPICIIAGLDGRCNTKDTTKTLLMNHDNGAAITYVNSKERYTERPFAYTALQGILLENIYSEELRLLYVAFTRAMDKLILIGKETNSISSFLLPDTASPESVLCDYSPIRWTLRSILRGVNEGVAVLYDDSKEDGKKMELGNSTTIFTHYNSTLTLPEQQADVDAEKTAESANADITKRINDYLNMQYKYIEETRMLAKYTVTELAHKDDEDEYQGVYINPTDFDADRKPTGKEVGDAYHHFMEHCDLEKIKVCPDDKLESLVTEMIVSLAGENKLSAREQDILFNTKSRVKNLACFFKSELGRQMLSDTSKVVREFALLAPLPAKELGIVDETCEANPAIPIQGRTDMFFYTDEGIVLVDYKSDTAANLEKQLYNYCTQLMIYKKLLPANQKQKVHKIYIYCFSDGGRTIDADEYLNNHSKENNYESN